MNLHNFLTVESLLSNLIVFIVAVLLTNWWHKRNKKEAKLVKEVPQPIQNEMPIQILRTYRDDTKRFGFAYLERHTPAIIEKLMGSQSSGEIDEAAVNEVIVQLRDFQRQFKEVGTETNEQEKCKIMVLNYVNKTLIRWKQLSEEKD